MEIKKNLSMRYYAPTFVDANFSGLVIGIGDPPSGLTPELIASMMYLSPKRCVI